MGRFQRPSTVTTLVEAGLAPSTRRFYNRVWNQLATDQFQGGRIQSPVGPDRVADYLAGLFQRGCNPSTMASHASAIAFGHRIRGWPDPTPDFRLRQLLKGAGKLRVTCDQRQTLTLQTLLKLCTNLRMVGLHRNDRITFRAILLLGFFGLLRPGELVRGSAPQHTLRLSDIRLSGTRLTLRLPSSKTSAAPQTITLDAKPGRQFCPVQAMRDFLRVRPEGGSQLFIDAAGSAISTARLSMVLQRTAIMSGMSPVGISGHCLRIGGASHGAVQGMSELQLAEAGRWRSRAVRRYVRRYVSVLSLT